MTSFSNLVRINETLLYKFKTICVVLLGNVLNCHVILHYVREFYSTTSRIFNGVFNQNISIILIYFKICIGTYFVI